MDGKSVVEDNFNCAVIYADVAVQTKTIFKHKTAQQ